MKFFVIVCFVVSSTLVSGRPETANVKIDTKEDELRTEYCNFPPYSPFRRECALFKCSKDGTRVLTIPCPYSSCPNKGSHQEETLKPFPECCPPLTC